MFRLKHMLLSLNHRSYNILGSERASTDGGDFSSAGLNITESSVISRRYGNNMFSHKGYNLQQFSPNMKHSSQFDGENCCDPVLAANMASLALNLNPTKYKSKK